MFHRYVTTQEGNLIDFDRSLYMTDKNLLAEASACLPEELGETPFDRFIQMRMSYATPLDIVQNFFTEYSRLHKEKYNKTFNPDVM